MNHYHFKSPEQEELMAIDKQRAMDIVVNYFASGGRNGLDHRGMNCFATSSGGHCAVGIILKRCGIAPHHNRCSISSLARIHRAAGIDSSDVDLLCNRVGTDFLRSMQGAHDRAADAGDREPHPDDRAFVFQREFASGLRAVGDFFDVKVNLPRGFGRNTRRHILQRLKR